MEKNHVAAILTDGLSNIDIDITKEQAIKIAKQIRKPMFDWHLIIGYIAAGIFVFRIIYNATKKSLYDPKTTTEKFQLWIYRGFYILLGFTLITGLLIKFGPDFIHGIAEEIHKLTLFYMIPFLIIHFTGITLAEFGSKKGIVSKMIGGESKG